MKRRTPYEAKRVAELVEAGRRTVKTYVCPKCGAACLRGDDDDNHCMVAVVDVEPISEFAELCAVLDGVGTYDICPAVTKLSLPGTYILYARDDEQYSTSTRPYPVLVEHVCKVAA